MKEEIEKLLALQEIDLEALRLREQLVLYPPMLKRIERNLARKKKEHEIHLEKKKEAKKQRRTLEKEIQFKEEQIGKKQEQQMAPKIKQDAYDALKHEIENLKKQINLMEDKILESISSEEELDKRMAEEQQRLNSEEEDADLEKKRIEEQVKSKKERLAGLKKDREEILPDVPQRLLSYYERFYKSYGPNVVVRVQGDSCGGCHMRILPQVMVEIHRGDKIVSCEGCRRILIAGD